MPSDAIAGTPHDAHPMAMLHSERQADLQERESRPHEPYERMTGG